MAEKFGAWECPASIFLIDTTTDKDRFLPLLRQLEVEHKELKELKNYSSVAQNLALAYESLNDELGRKFLVMFAWDYINQTFLPFASECFYDDDCEAIIDILRGYIAAAHRCCCQGFDFTNMNTENKLLGYFVQTVCENEMMQIEIQRLKELN
jgi:hypothetical protein